MPYRSTHHTGGANGFIQVCNNTIDEKSLFRTSSDYQRFLTILKRLVHQSSAIKIIGYTLMRDSYHLIVQELEPGFSGRFIHRLSVGYVSYFQQKYKNVGKMFSGPYKRRALNDTEEVVIELVKMHLILRDTGQDPETYPWSSYKKYLNGQAPWLFKEPVKIYFNDSDIAKLLIDFTNSLKIS